MGTERGGEAFFKGKHPGRGTCSQKKKETEKREKKKETRGYGKKGEDIAITSLRENSSRPKGSLQRNMEPDVKGRGGDPAPREQTFVP